mmetsp:Transcript_21795/g.47439  ORF Transcript_21795/g.47439 Transcript_21795/m.47439 type:complete len:623 (+) Transcript_21795:111-1979(+)
MAMSLCNGCSGSRRRATRRRYNNMTFRRAATRGSHQHCARRLSTAVATLVTLLMATPNALNSCMNNFVVAKPSNRSFIGNIRSKRRSNQQEEKDSHPSGGLTLGDLEQMQINDEIGSNSSPPFIGPSPIFGSDNTQQSQSYYPDQAAAGEKESTSNPNSTQLRKSLRRINLDLSGRILCHVISPRNINHGDTHAPHGNGVDGRESVPLISLPSARQVKSQKLLRPENRLGRMIPHLYLGANYNLDEVWYGATRWIAKCSWGPLTSSSSAGETISKQGNYSPLSLKHRALHSASEFHQKILPSLFSGSSPKSSSWTINVEGEQSVFDHSDSTIRLSLNQSPPSVASKVNGGQKNLPHISMEYDSAKYADTMIKKHVKYAPTITMDVKTPFLHPRLEVHSRKTWIVKEGGDNDGNYYGGDYYGSQSCVDRRLEQIKERFRGSIPRSKSSISNTAAAQDRAPKFSTRLSQWLENDGWMPRKVTTNLLGNLIAVNEVGFAENNSRVACSNNERDNSKWASLRGIFPPVHNTGIRLRISKKMDYTSLGIFPWSRNNNDNTYAGNQQNGRGMMVDVLQSTRVRLELCGLYGSEKECASVGVDVVPLDWRKSMKVVVGRESVGVLGRQG